MGKWSISSSTVVRMVKAICIAAGMMIGLAAIIAVCIEREYVDIERIKIFLPFVWLISAFVCAYLAGERGGTSGVYHPIFATSLLYVSVLAAGIFLYEGINGVNVIFGSIASALGVVMGIVLRRRGKTTAHGRKRRRAYR